MLGQCEMVFDRRGRDGYDPAFDKDRLDTLLRRVYAALAKPPRRWMTLSELYIEAGGSEAGISARLRELRRKEHGAHVIGRRRRGEARRGIWEYRIMDPETR